MRFNGYRANFVTWCNSNIQFIQGISLRLKWLSNIYSILRGRTIKLTKETMMPLEGYLQKKFRNSFEDLQRPLKKSASFRSLKSVKCRLSGSRCSLKLQSTELGYGSRGSLDSSSSSAENHPGSGSYYAGPTRVVLTQVLFLFK